MKKCAIFCYFDESMMDGRTDRRTNRRTDRPCYRDARSHLKISCFLSMNTRNDELLRLGNGGISIWSIGWTVHWLDGPLVDQPIASSVSLLVGRPGCWSVSQSINQLVGWPRFYQGAPDSLSPWFYEKNVFLFIF